MHTLVKFITSLPFVTQIFLIICAFFIFASGILLTYLLFRKNKFLQNEVSKLMLRQQIDQILTEHIIKCNDHTPNSKSTGLLCCIRKFKEFPFQQEWVRNEIANRIIYHKQTFSGDINDQLTRVYLQMGFQQTSINNLRSGNRKVRLYAINELYHTDVKLDESLIQQLLRHNDPLTRKYARCFLIKHSPAASFQFLDDVRDHLLPWEQFELHSILAIRNIHDIPLFAQWIRSDLKPGVASFSIRMAVHFRQDDAIPLLIKLLDEASPQLKKEAVIALGKLKARKAEETLMKKFPQEGLAIKMEILKALGRISSGNCMHFLADVFTSSANMEIKTFAMNSLEKLGKPALALIGNLPAGENVHIEMLIQQSYNPISKN